MKKILINPEIREVRLPLHDVLTTSTFSLTDDPVEDGAMYTPGRRVDIWGESADKGVTRLF